MLTDSADSSQALLHFLYRAPIGLVQAELDGAIEMINPMAAQLLMPLCRNGKLDNLFAVLDEVAPHLRESVERVDDANGTVCDGTRVQISTVSRGVVKPAVLSLSLVKLHGSRLMAMISDVTLEVQNEDQKLARELRDAARIDQLTLLPNRAVVQEDIQSALDHPLSPYENRFAVLFMNCDRFHQINNTLGHVTGDRMLVLVANRLQKAIRANCGDTVARTGSDEFVVLITDPAGLDDVQSIARRILKSLASPYHVGENILHCTVSMGIVFQPGAAGDGMSILEDASIAMMGAKRAGGNCSVVFEPEMRLQAVRLGTMETELRQAIAALELRVVYQPVVSLQETISLHGCESVEALVRWQHPSRGLLAPAEFIGIAEECGLIGQIGEFVIKTACFQFVKWQREMGSHAPRTIAVNLSREQLTDPHLLNAIRDILVASAMPAGQLQLEVTESLAAQDVGVRSCLHQIRAMGITLALDDFGTGFSSLSCLHLLPVDTIKIDRSFVTEADVSPHHRVLIEATVLVAKSLGMHTIAEGIETVEQEGVVRQLGCDNGQGYLFSKPLAPSDLEKWLTTSRSV